MIRDEFQWVDDSLKEWIDLNSWTNGGRSSKVDVRNSGTHGLGWFANSDIPRGQIIFTPYNDDVKLDFKVEEILSWPQERRRKFFKISYQVDDDIYNGYHSDTDITEEKKLDWHLNHSCDPNVAYIDKDVVVTLKDIKKGDELLYDYATTQCNEKMAMPCNCQGPDCRKMIRGDDWKVVKSKYSLQFFLPYIRRKIQQQ